MSQSAREMIVKVSGVDVNGKTVLVSSVKGLGFNPGLVDGARLQALQARLSALGETEAELHLAYADICGGQVELLTA